MDPVTAALNFATELLRTIQLVIATMPEAERAAAAQRHERNIQQLEEFFARIQGQFRGPNA